MCDEPGKVYLHINTYDNLLAMPSCMWEEEELHLRGELLTAVGSWENTQICAFVAQICVFL